MFGERVVPSFDPIENAQKEFDDRASAGAEMGRYVSQAIQLGYCVKIQVCNDEETVVYEFNYEECCDEEECCDGAEGVEGACSVEIVFMDSDPESDFVDPSVA